MNPALIAAILAAGMTRKGYVSTSGPALTKDFAGHGWITRLRLKRLRRLLRRDAQDVAMRRTIDEDRNERRWAAYFKMIGGRE